LHVHPPSLGKAVKASRQALQCLTWRKRACYPDLNMLAF
jgi:hypothetical protein